MAKIEGPDQARSWVIALAACVINTMLSGISRATGIFYVALLEEYGVTRMQANMPFTMRNSVRNLAGPVVGILGQKYGVRTVTLIGGVMATLGIIFCSLAPDIIWIIVLWGGLHGLGVAFANTLFQVTVNQYFEKYRATASGIALSGACAGSFVFPVALEMILNYYNLSSAFLLTGGLIMHVIPAAIILKEPSWLGIVKPETSNNQKTHKVKLETIKEVTRKENADSVETSEDEMDDPVTHGKKNSSVELHKSKNLSKVGKDNLGYMGSSLSVTQSTTQDKVRVSVFKCRKPRTVSAGEVSVTIPAEKLEETDSMVKCMIKVYTNPMFYMISISLAVFALQFDPLLTVIVDYIKDKGLDDHVGKYLISVLSLGDLIGRLCFGWVTDKDYVSLPKFMLLTHVSQGVCFVLFPLFYSFETLMGISIVYGVSAGMTIVIFPVLVAKFLANEQSLAIGCIAFVAGIMSFAVAPLIGHFRDSIGSYDGMFYITGGMSVLMGFFWLMEPCLRKLRNQPEDLLQDKR